MRLVKVDFSLLNPCCSLTITCLRSKVNFSRTKLSNSLESLNCYGTIEFVTSALLADLKIGTTKAMFQVGRERESTILQQRIIIY